MAQSRSLPSPPEITDAKYNDDPIKNNSNNKKSNREQFNNSSKSKNKDDNNTTPFKSGTATPPLSTSISTQNTKTTALVPTITASNNKTILKPPSKRSFSDTATISILDKLNIIHDPNYCMFKIQLDAKGNTAALCYLPTRYKNIIEFYHIEIPTAYRNQGLGDLLLYKAFEWVQKANMMVIPTCPFVLRFLETRVPDHKSGNWSCIILSDEKETTS